MYVLRGIPVVTMGCSIDSLDVCFGTQLVDSRGDISGNLSIGVDACFFPCFSDRNLGALFEVLSVGLNIMNLKLFDAYRIIDPRILVVTLEYLGDIRVKQCDIWCYCSMISRVVCDTYKDGSID